MTNAEKKSIARSYWTHCYREWDQTGEKSRPVMRPEDMAFYLVGFSAFASEAQIKEAIKRLRSIRLLPKIDTYNLNPGLVRDVLRDIVTAGDDRAAQEFRQQAGTWGRS